MGLAQQLQRRLFSSEHRPAFEDMLDSFWNLFDFQRSAKELCSLLQQFLQLLLNFVAASPFAATHYLQKYVPLLQDLQVCLYGGDCFFFFLPTVSLSNRWPTLR